MKSIALALSVILTPCLTYASDHIDGPLTTQHRVADLTDFFAFPTPGKAESLTLILNTYPLVPNSGHFTDKAIYTFYIRRASSSGQKAFQTAEEIAIHCTFETPEVTSNHKVTCRSTNGLFAQSKFNQIKPSVLGNDFDVYAGVRSDPFFFDAQFAQGLASAGKVPKSGASNTMGDINMLSIVVDIEMKSLYPIDTPTLLALAVDVTDTNTPAKRLDRIGRPEITNVSLLSIGKVADLRDQYNLDRPFAVDADIQAAYATRLFENIDIYDKADQRVDWNLAEREALAQILADDFLVLDLSKPCTGDQFLEIEKALLRGAAHQSCGGRKTTDDIMDTLHTLYVSEFSGRKIGDGVNAPAKSISQKFPYLAEPETGLFARLKRKAAAMILGIEGLL